ncbi:MAG: DUF484 family protein, partial [Pseudomonadota bacterium]
HRAVLQLLEPTNFESFIKALTGEVAQTLRVDVVRLVLESLQDDPETDPTLRRLGDVLQVVPAGFVGHYLTNGRNGAGRQIVLRSVTTLAPTLYGERAEDLQSEALMKLDLGPNRLPGMLVFASEDPTQFKSTHGTDLLQFFAGVFERSMRRWLG